MWPAELRVQGRELVRMVHGLRHEVARAGPRGYARPELPGSVIQKHLVSAEVAARVAEYLEHHLWWKPAASGSE